MDQARHETAVGRLPVRISRRRAVLGGVAGVGSAVLALAAGCAPSGASDRASGSGPSAALPPQKLLWQVRSTPTYPDVVKWGIEQFTQRHPHVTVETTQNAGDVEKTLALMVAGEGPDVFHAWGHRMWQYAAKGRCTTTTSCCEI